MFNDYPYTNFNEINLDWIMSEDKKQNDELSSLDNRVSALESGGTASAEEVYYCTYGTTTNAEIEAAMGNDMIPVCIYNNRLYILSTKVSATYHVFFTGDQIQTRRLIVSSNIWSSDTTDIAPEDSPNFTGTPTAPTPAYGDASTKIATTQYVNYLRNNIADQFYATTNYAAGDYVFYNGTLYKFTSAHSAGVWTGADVESVVFGTELENVTACFGNEPALSSYPWAIGAFNATGGEASSTTRIRSGFIPVTAGSIIRVSGNANCLNGVCYDSEKLFINNMPGWASSYIIPSGVSYFRFMVRVSTANPVIADADIPAQVSRCSINWKLNEPSFFVDMQVTKGLNEVLQEYTCVRNASGNYAFPFMFELGEQYTIYNNADSGAFTAYTTNVNGAPNASTNIDSFGTVNAGNQSTIIATADASFLVGYANSATTIYICKTQSIGNKLRTEFKQADVKREIKNAQHIPQGLGVPLTILHISDPHANANALTRIMNDADSVGATIDDYICTGDMVADVGGAISSWWDSKVMTVVGNHDSATKSGGVYNWTGVSMANRAAYYIEPFESEWNINHTSGLSYYYKDYATQKVRLVVMDVMLYKDNGAEATAQTSWLTYVLSDAIANSLHVLIAIHTPHDGSAPVDCSFSKYDAETFPLRNDGNTPQTVIDTVATAITNGLNFIGYLCGHVHQDGIWDAENDGTQIMYSVTCASTAYNAWYFSDQFRSPEYDAYNVVTIDTENTLIKIARGGGANIDNVMRTRKAICFNYSTGTKCGEVL